MDKEGGLEMHKFVALFVFFFASAFAAPVFAHPSKSGHVDVTFSETKTFLNKDCRRDNSCDLVRFSLMLDKYEVWFSDYDTKPSYGTSIVAEYETVSVEDLEKYAIVQFIRGCSFESIKKSDGIVEKFLGVSREHFGVSKYFCFPEWVIDSVDTDPVYYSNPELGRHYFYKWNYLGSHNRKTEKFYGEEKPHIPILYITDLPDRAFLSDQGARNVSLEFKTCLYRTKEVPLSTKQDDLNFATPVQCFEWQSFYIYNFDLAVFESKSEIDPFCKQEPPPY